MPEQPYFSAEAHCHGTLDQSRGEVPEWCDLTLTVEILDPKKAKGWRRAPSDTEATLFMTRAAGEVLIDVLHDTLHPWQGGSLVTIMERRLDEVVARLLAGNAEEGDKFLGRGMAEMIAILRNPYQPSWEAVRDASVERVQNGEEAE